MKEFRPEHPQVPLGNHELLRESGCPFTAGTWMSLDMRTKSCMKVYERGHKVYESMKGVNESMKGVISIYMKGVISTHLTKNCFDKFILSMEDET